MSIARLISLLLLVPLFSVAQNNASTNAPSYPQDYFRNPLDIPIFLAGNFGECRPGHFHSGVDIKTLGKEGQPVHAAADGYISRIKMEKGGFGHGIYITHPNGYTTLYAHLGDFAPALQKYLRKEQYEKKHWDVDIALPADKFPVKKGQQIAWSGNTGASTAPHLHFEIRNTKTEHPLNPELFGLPVVDKIAPVPAEVVFFLGGNAQYSTVFDNIQDKGKSFRYTVPVQKAGGIYKPYNKSGYGKVNNDTVDVQFINGSIGIGVNVDDYMDGSDNTIAFYNAKMLMDDTLQAEITLDNIGYDETRYINAYADYPSKEKDNKWVQCFFKLPGNHLDAVYTFLIAQNGNLRIRDSRPHKIDVIFTDDRGNKSEIKFYLRNPLPEINFGGSRCTVYDANSSNTYTGKYINFSLDDKELYDMMCMHVDQQPYAEGISDKFIVGDTWIPVHHYFDLRIAPNKAIAAQLKNKDTVSFYVSAYPGKKMIANISRKAMNISTQLHSEKIEMDVWNKEETLSPGMYADVMLYSKGSVQAYTVVKTAVVTSTERKYVISVRGNKAVKVDVVTGNETSDKVEIFGNLEDGDTIVINANDEIKEGSEIK